MNRPPVAGVRVLTAVCVAVEIAIHAYLAPDHLHEMPYMGVLFVVASVLLTGVLAGIAFAPRSDAVWVGGALVCAGMVVGFVASRTVGLPGYHEGWTSDSSLGLWSLPPDVVVVLAAARLARRSVQHHQGVHRTVVRAAVSSTR